MITAPGLNPCTGCGDPPSFLIDDVKSKTQVWCDTCGHRLIVCSKLGDHADVAFRGWNVRHAK